MSSFVRTVLGDVPAGELGVCYAHEHIVIDRSYVTTKYPEYLLDSVQEASDELAEFYGNGGRAMIDAMPCDSGRNPVKLAEISRNSGVHIVCPTGLHLEQYYDKGHWGFTYTEDQITQLFVADINDGIDSNDYNGPLVNRTEHRAGLIKVAGAKDKLTDHQCKTFTCAARAQVETGCPILTHCEQGAAALEQIDIFSSNGADLNHVCLSHTDRKFDFEYHREVLSTGVKLEYDSAFRWKEDQGNPTLDLLVKLLPEFPDQIMLGMDTARRSYWKHYGGSPGLSFLLTDYVPRLKEAGVTNELLHKLWVTTPAATYSFKNN